MTVTVRFSAGISRVIADVQKMNYYSTQSYDHRKMVRIEYRTGFGEKTITYPMDIVDQIDARED